MIFTSYNHLIQAGKKGYKFSWLANKKIGELLLIFITILYPLLLIIDWELFYIFNFMIVCSIILTIGESNRWKENYWSTFKLVVYSSILIQILGNISKVLSHLYGMEDQSVLSVIIIFLGGGVLLYFGIALVCILSIVNLLFYVCLKLLFPSELNFVDEVSSRQQNVTMRELSQYMTVNEQITYLIVALSTAAIFSAVAVFGAEIFGRFLNNNDYEMKSLFRFIEFEWFTLANTIGIISVLIALLNITIPLQNKLYHLAYEKYKSVL